MVAFVATMRRSNHKKQIKKPTKPKKPTKRATYGLVLSGGAALGAYQAGAIQALFEAGLSFRCVAGSSIGALNGYLAATREVERMLDFWKKIDRGKLITVQSFTKILFSGGTAFLSDQLQRSLVEQAVHLDALKKSRTKYICTAISLNTGRLHYFHGNQAKNDRELREFILASAAVPGIFPPVKIGEELFMDGGLVRNTPIDALIGERVDTLIAISMEPEHYPEEKLHNTGQIALRTLSIFFRSQANDAMERARYLPQRRVKKILLLRPQLPLPMQQYEFDPKKIAHLIELGYRAGQQFIVRHKLR
ncbi:MAG: patatin-like phospholipase family protein [Leptospiraceae bacterium]|nr:patatin-like phospholipase family protein [Leptospiraceae bacterium]